MSEALSGGYSNTPLGRKLGIKPGSRVAVLGAPAGFVERLEDVAPPHTRLRGRFDVIVAFADSRARWSAASSALIAALEPRGGLWIAWPKRSSGVATDLDEHVVRELGLARRAGRQQGLRDRRDLVGAALRQAPERSLSAPRGARRVQPARGDLVEQTLELGVAGEPLLEVAAQARDGQLEHLVAQVAPAALRALAAGLGLLAVGVERRLERLDAGAAERVGA